MPIDGSGSGIGNSGSGIVSGGGGEEISLSQRKERHPPTMKTINEDEPRRVSKRGKFLSEELGVERWMENEIIRRYSGNRYGRTLQQEQQHHH